MKPVLIITNNPAVIGKYQGHEMVIKETMREVFIATRDLIHQGHKLISHPLPGSVKPNETPYRSIMVSLKPEEAMDLESLTYIEHALLKFEQFQRDKSTPNWIERILKDFQFVDLSLFDSGYQSLVN